MSNIQIEIGTLMRLGKAIYRETDPIEKQRLKEELDRLNNLLNQPNVHVIIPNSYV